MKRRYWRLRASARVQLVVDPEVRISALFGEERSDHTSALQQVVVAWHLPHFVRFADTLC